MNTSKLLLLLCFVGVSGALSISLVPQNEAQESSNATQTTMPTTIATSNFSQAISQQISSDPFLVDVPYESPKTVILQGSISKVIEGGLGLAFNDFLWRGVDLLKDQGFTIDQIDLIRSGETQESYRIYMSLNE